MLDKLELEVMLVDESLVAERSWNNKSPFKEQQSANEKPEMRLWGERASTSPQSKGSEERKQQPSDLISKAPFYFWAVKP